MMRAKQADDEGLGAIVGSLVLVAIVVVGAVIMYASIPPVAPSSPAPGALLVTSASRSSAETYTFGVSSATPGFPWSRVQMTLDGAPLAYDADLDAAGTYCVLGPDGDCLSTPGRVEAGQRARLRDAAPEGKTLRIVDAEANIVLVQMRLG